MRDHGVRMGMSFRVSGLVPPKKDGANSMWRKPAAIEQLKALRTAAAQAMADREAWDEPVTLALRLYVPAPQGEPTLRMRRQHGDLDSFITGVSDGLQAADPRAIDADTWADLPPEAEPSRTGCLHRRLLDPSDRGRAGGLRGR
jgi:hypothetical protein